MTTAANVSTMAHRPRLNANPLLSPIHPNADCPSPPRVARYDGTGRIRIKDHRHWKFTVLAFVCTVVLLVSPGTAHSQEVSPPKAPTAATPPTNRNVIIIGFVGGFVSRNDTKHPEVQFAAYLRDRYPTIHVDVFGNHHGRKALRHVVSLLDADRDGVLSSIEKEQATVIVYGHSWGATETVAFADDLGQIDIPVALTILIDTIAKPGRKASAISPNVESAINFYQTRGPLHGAPEIVAADPARTKILGNIRMTYENRPINCDNYSWYSRTLNKPHHEIENDLRVWNQIASLIHADLPGTPSIAQAPPPSRSPFFQYLRRGPQAEETEAALLEIPGDGNGN
jgi:pimeloyl-ACP methyl ester carboxylesterase